MREWMKMILSTLMLFAVSLGIAQTVTVSGTVTDEFGPAPDVQVTAQQSGETTTTDENGFYEIEAAPDDTLEFLTIMGVSQSMAVNNQTTVNMNLREEIVLEDVVAIGYGTADSRDLTGSISKVEGEVVADKPSANPVASLQGRVSGLSVVNSGRIGQQPDVRIRGTSSRYNTQPLYVVDGIFADNIDFINPNDIESIEVLKDASSLAIFGVRGANGVIIVTTKTGDKDKVTFNLNSSIGFKEVVGQPEMANADLFKELFDEGMANAGSDPYPFYDLFTGDTDWVDVISNNAAVVQTNNISVQSSSENNKLSVGLGYREENGLIIKEKLQRITLNIQNELEISDNFKIGVTVNALKDKLPNQGNFTPALNATPIVDPIHYDSREQYNGYYNQLPDAMGAAQIGNPLLVNSVTKNKNIGERYRFLGNIFAEVKFLKDFKFRSTFYGDYQNVKSTGYTPIIDIFVPEADTIAAFNGTQLTRVNQESVNILNFQQDYLLSYDKEIGQHEFNVTAGFTTYLTEYESIFGQIAHDPDVGRIPDDPRFWYLGVYPYGDPESETNGSTQWDRATTSFLGRVLYNYDGKYLVNASYRRDATSQLSPDNRAQDFWAVGLGWVASNETFLRDFSALNFLKFKGSYGLLGNQFVPVNYPYYPGVDAGATAVFGENVIPGYIKRFEENPNLKWETITSWEAGFESNWLQNRLMLNAVYYNRLTEDLLVYVDTGVEEFFDNQGEIENKGFEIEASWTDDVNENFSYSFGGNFTTIENEVLSTREDAAILSGTASRTISGQPIGHFYGYIVDGVYQTNAQINELPTSSLGNYGPGDLIYRDVNEDGIINDEDRTVIGNPTPDFTYGFYANFEYKGLYLNTDFVGVYGNEIYRDWGNGSSFTQFNYRADRANRWTGPGTSNWEPRINEASAYNNAPSTYMIEDGSFFRIRNIQLGYTFRDLNFQQLNIQQMKLYFNVENAYTWKNNSGFSPEAGGSPIEFGIDNGGYPVPRIMTLGLNVTF